MKDYFLFLWLYFKLAKKYKYKIKPFSRYGTFEYSFCKFSCEYKLKNVHISILKSPENRLEVLFHEIGHLVCLPLYYKYGYGDSTNILKAERDASKFAIRVLRLLRKDTKLKRQYLLKAYETYVSYYDCNKAEESYAGVKAFGIKYP